MEEFDLENPFQEVQSETVSSLFEAESDHMPSENVVLARDFDVSVRHSAVSLIMKAQCVRGLDPSVAYLAVNYLDRFVSGQSVPQGKPWIVKLLSISCISLAAKMKKTVCSLTDFQSEEGFIFDSQTIRRMEFLILGALKWRMRSITPFSFLSFFLSYFEFKDLQLKDSLKSRAADIIFKAQNDIKLLEYKPSTIAASALLWACHELLPAEFPCFRDAVSVCVFVNEGKLLDCYDQLQEVVMDGYDSTFEKPQSAETPPCVLDRQFSNAESDNTSVPGPKPEPKR